MLSVRFGGLIGAVLLFGAVTAAAQLPVLEQANERNLELRAELAQLDEQTAAATELSESIDREIAQLNISLKNTDERLAIVGLSGAVAQLLIAERQRLKSAKDQVETLSAVQRDIASAKLKRIDFREERAWLAQPLQAASAASNDPAEVSALVSLYADRKKMLPRLEAAQDALLTTLSSAELKLTRRIELSTRLKLLLDERLLWTPSEAPINLAFLRQLPSAWQEFFALPRWHKTATLVLTKIAAAPLLLLLGMLILLALQRLRRYTIVTLDAIAEHARHAREVDFRPTIVAFSLSLLAALKWPLTLALIALLLRSAGEAGRFSDSLGRALLAVAAVYAALSVLAWMLRERGVAHAHFRWTQKRRAALRGMIKPLALVLLPMVGFATLNAARDLTGEPDAVGRCVFIIGSLLLAWISFVTLRNDGIGVRRGLATEASPLLRKLIRAALCTTLLALAVLSIYGYHLSALAIAERLLNTALAVLVLVLAHGLIGRWLVLNERRLIFQRRDERREQQKLSPEETADAPTEAEAAEITIERIGDQTRRLLRALTLTTTALLMWGIWAELLPALNVLDTITLWHSSAQIDGELLRTAVTIKSLLLSSLAIALMLVALNNLGGLLELLLNRLRLDAPTRYAILSIARYMVVVIGLSLALGWLGLRWGHFQWLAAAFTVGLGFGLQEIFANFVSGLILLFERPFRVGDTITVGTYSGTVTRIRTRATTLLDWDNKEIVIPNKTFITGQLTNWTLSDNVTRVSIKLMLAHGSEPAMVHRTLREVASAHPLVLKDPAPSTWLSNLSDTAMEFNLNFFVGALGHRLRATNDVLESISAHLRDHSLALALPVGAAPAKPA